MLSRLDDYPVHQTPEPLAHPAASDRNVYDRYWFNGYSEDGELYFGIAMGLYPNRGILDAAFSVVCDGEQHAFHASRRAPQDPSETEVGPLRIEILEPMRRIRVTLAPNETGIACDLVFTARTACVEEGRQTLRQGHRIAMDATRFAQFGRWEGEIHIQGRSLRMEAERIFGTKDRSWGIRPVGEPEIGGAPATTLPSVYFLWAPLQWPDHCTHFCVFEDSGGHMWHYDGARIPLYAGPQEVPGVVDERVERMRDVERRIVYEPGTRRAERAEIALVAESGERLEIALEPLLCFRMKGIGYTHPEWGHGRWKGELAVGGESWKTDSLDPLAIDNLHIQQVVRATAGDRVGIGVLEQICIGPHAPSGFRGLLDGAPAS